MILAIEARSLHLRCGRPLDDIFLWRDSGVVVNRELLRLAHVVAHFLAELVRLAQEAYGVVVRAHRSIGVVRVRAGIASSTIHAAEVVVGVITRTTRPV